MRQARRALIGLGGKQLAEFTEEDRINAERTVQGYDVIAILIREGLVPMEPIISSWGASIRSCRAAAAESIVEARAKYEDTYWDDFDWLQKQVPPNAQEL